VKTDFDPTRPLPNAKQERFCQLVLGGASVPDAFAQAGYKPEPKNAYRLFARSEIKARIEYLKSAAAKQLVVRVADAGARKAEAQAEQVIHAKKSRDEVLKKLWENAMPRRHQSERGG